MLASFAPLCIGLLSVALLQRSLLHLSPAHLLVTINGIAIVCWNPTKNAHKLYAFEVPGVNIKQVGRGSISVQMIPHHEAIDETLKADPGAMLKLEEVCAGHEVPRRTFTILWFNNMGLARYGPSDCLLMVLLTARSTP